MLEVGIHRLPVGVGVMWEEEGAKYGWRPIDWAPLFVSGYHEEDE